MGQFKKRGNAKGPITAVITAVITAREYYREAPWKFLMCTHSSTAVPYLVQYYCLSTVQCTAVVLILLLYMMFASQSCTPFPQFTHTKL